MFLALMCRRFLRQGPSYTHCCLALTLSNSVSYAFLLNLTEKSHKLSRIRVQTCRKATKVVADVSRVCGLAITDVTDGVADGHEESIGTRKSVMSTSKSLWVILVQLGLCAAMAGLSSRH